MPPAQRFLRLLNVFESDQQLGPADGGIHATSVVGPDHGRDAGLVQDAFRNLGVRR